MTNHDVMTVTTTHKGDKKEGQYEVGHKVDETQISATTNLNQNENTDSSPTNNDAKRQAMDELLSVSNPDEWKCDSSWLDKAGINDGVSSFVDDAGNSSKTKSAIITWLNDRSIYAYQRINDADWWTHDFIKDKDDFLEFEVTYYPKYRESPSMFGLCGVVTKVEEDGVKLMSFDKKKSHVHFYPIKHKDIAESKRDLEVYTLANMNEESLWLILWAQFHKEAARDRSADEIYNHYEDDWKFYQREISKADAREEKTVHLFDMFAANFVTMTRSLQSIYEPLASYIKWREDTKLTDAEGSTSDSALWKEEILAHRRLYQRLENQINENVDEMLWKDSQPF